ncbi:MAG TPA: hypothetical protein VLM89_00520 [Phycisphaerae bacterium]|nr:hypothetical protein [Phycisphaerae bacterium]
MKHRTTRILMWLALGLGGSTVFQTIGFTNSSGAVSGGCRDFSLNGATSAVDMCFLLDCQNGFFGGLIDPCDPQKPALLDCPNYVPPTTNQTGTTTGTGTSTGGFAT